VRLRATVARNVHCCMMSHSRLAGHQELVIAALASFDAPAAE